MNTDTDPVVTGELDRIGMDTVLIRMSRLCNCSRIASEHRSARAGPSKTLSTPSPVVLMTRPPNRATSFLMTS